MRSGALEEAINRYKYKGLKGWASIFGRVLVGYLDSHPRVAEDWDALIPNPTFTGPGAQRNWDHIRLILEKADVEAGGRWPFFLNPQLIEKVSDTPRLVGMTLAERKLTSETKLRSALRVPDPSLVKGRSFLVFDDVFTDGSTLREVSRSLRLAGASQVGGIVLARQPWGN